MWYIQLFGIYTHKKEKSKDICYLLYLSVRSNLKQEEAMKYTIYSVLTILFLFSKTNHAFLKCASFEYNYIKDLYVKSMPDLVFYSNASNEASTNVFQSHPFVKSNIHFYLSSFPEEYGSNDAFKSSILNLGDGHLFHRMKYHTSDDKCILILVIGGSITCGLF
jgi:hypothetical protein